MVLAGFSSFVVMYPRKTKMAHNSTAHSETTLGTFRGYYEHKHGRAPGTGLNVDFNRTLRGITN